MEEVKEERSSCASEGGSSSEEEEEMSGEELERKMHSKFEQLKLSTPAMPSAPPSYNPMACQGTCSCCTTCGSGRVSSWRDHDLASAFPVLEDQNNQRYHQPLDFKLVKQLKEAVMQYGPQAAFMVSLLETLTSLLLVS